jgi:hypothetical protein
MKIKMGLLGENGNRKLDFKDNHAAPFVLSSRRYKLACLG